MKQEKTPFKVLNYKSSVLVRSKDKRVNIVQARKDDESRNMIHITSMTKDTGNEPGVQHKLSQNEKLKYSLVGLSDDALIDLHIALTVYLKRKRDNSLTDINEPSQS